MCPSEPSNVGYEPGAPNIRMDVNSAIPLEFENDIFVGRVAILHRVPQDIQSSGRYREFFAGKKRRWELRWQGRFKQPLEDKIVFGAEISASSSPRLNFASRAFLSILLKFAQSLARNRGADLYTNTTSDMAEGTKYFYFPVHTSDLIVRTPEGEAPPDICSPSGVSATDRHVQCNSLLKNPAALDRSFTYTFVFYSMYLDFLSWDIQNVPIGLNGMSLNRLIGNQPVSVVMKCQQTDSTFFRLLIANRCVSPDWSSYLSTGERFNAASISEFFSVISSFDSEEIHVRRAPNRTRRRSSSSLWQGVKKFFSAPSRFLSHCWRAPVTFAVESASRRTPRMSSRRSKTQRLDSLAEHPPNPLYVEGIDTPS